MHPKAIRVQAGLTGAATPTPTAVAVDAKNANAQLVISCEKAPDAPMVAQLVSEDDIRLYAYQKWENAGKPAEDGIRFWLEAEREVLQKK